MITKQIMNLIPTIQATALLGENVKAVKKKKVKTKEIVGLGLKNIVGIELIKLESGLISTI